jgi:hypothetical protein
MITIKQPVIFQLNDTARIQNVIDVDGSPRELWFEVGRNYGAYLCDERADAYVIGLLHWAMENRHDITCEIPLGEELYYQLTTYLIPAVANATKNLYPSMIFAPVDSRLMPNAGAVGTGLSCGIDSLHVLANQTESPYRSFNITHLLYNNVGANGIGEEGELLCSERKQMAEAFAEETGYKLIETNSNFAEIFEQIYPLVHTYSNVFAVYMMQKFWNVYFYASSGFDFSEFSLKNNDDKDSAYYDLLSLDCFSTRSLRFYSEGGAKTRFEKTKTVIKYLPAKKYLNVCCAEGKNCGKCEKCMRTLLTLDALGVLDEFQAVFDIDYYKAHKNHYYSWLCLRKIQKDRMIKEPFEILFLHITWFNWIVAFKEIVRIELRKIPFLHTLYKKLKDAYCLLSVPKRRLYWKKLRRQKPNEK